jgi:S-formylglutathione hydrolase FrmB
MNYQYPRQVTRSQHYLVTVNGEPQMAPAQMSAEVNELAISSAETARMNPTFSIALQKLPVAVLLFVGSSMSTMPAIADTPSPTPALESTNFGYGKAADGVAGGRVVMIPSAANTKSFATLLVAPTNADDAALRGLDIIFLLHGRNDFEVSEKGLQDMYGNGHLQEIADMFRVILVAPMVGNTFYLDSPIDPEVRAGTFVQKELPVEIDRILGRSSTREQRILCGFSMGGYGAVATLCQAPETYSVALSRAGAGDLATGVLDLGWDDAAFPLEVLGSYWDNPKLYRDHSCLTLLPRLKGREDVAFVVEVGVEDFLLTTNRKLRESLRKNGLRHTYTEVPGGHRYGADVLVSLLASLQEFRPTLPFLQPVPASAPASSGR